jgi:hypothetical protein
MTMLSRVGRLYRWARLARNVATNGAKGLHKVHPTALVHWTCQVARDLQAEPYAFVGPNCSIAPMVRIGKYSLLAPRVAIVGLDHNWGIPASHSFPVDPHTNRPSSEMIYGLGTAQSSCAE